MQSIQESLRLLVVDDDESIRLLLMRALHRFGMDVDGAADGNAALESVRQAQYDLIICDLLMPGMNGQSFYRALLREWPLLRQRVIFITGDLMSDDARGFLQASGCLYLAKPFSIQLLLNTVIHASKHYPPSC